MASQLYQIFNYLWSCLSSALLTTRILDSLFVYLLLLVASLAVLSWVDWWGHFRILRPVAAWPCSAIIRVGKLTLALSYDIQWCFLVGQITFILFVEAIFLVGVASHHIVYNFYLASTSTRDRLCDPAYDRNCIWVEVCFVTSSYRSLLLVEGTVILKGRLKVLRVFALPPVILRRCVLASLLNYFVLVWKMR